ncbi:poly(A) polymerase [Streptosporangium sp. V21-05]|uniref:poly(A) polymerase n=1 Tax=Streptosporangium sp. V21-05 TaxID=3446115 RepID=UPI003F53D350
MRTSEEIFHRVRWDPRFDPARFVLGIHVRGAAPKRLPLPAFVPGGDIPWHRILFVEADGETVWDRSAGLDLIDSSQAGRVRDPRRLRAPFFTARTPFSWDPVAGWRPAAPAPAPAPAGYAPAATCLRVLTWNTLWDRYDSDRLDTARRRPMLLEELERADADVIALQEVEAELLGMLLRTPWIRSAYTLSTDPSGRDVDNDGLLLLTRLPVLEVGTHALGPHKAVTAVTVESAAGPIVVAVTHLSSDHSDNGPARRGAELARLAEGLLGVDGDVILAGDLNDGGSGPAEVLGLRDAWTEIHGPGDPTATFDPRVNPLAALSSLSGRASRLDRVLLRGHDLRVTAAALRGDSPAADGLFVSDHYGVVVDIATGHGSSDVPGSPGMHGASGVPGTSGKRGPSGVSSSPGAHGASGIPGLSSTRSASGIPDASGTHGASGVSGSSGTRGFTGVPGVLDARPTVRTAVVWIPPAELWPAIQEIRREHDPRSHRWPPHVTVMFGFVPESSFERAAPVLAAATAAIPPFTARLRGVRAFSHRDGSTVWLDPASDGPEPWAALRAALERGFPHCRGRSGDYTPHLTLGRVRDPGRFAADWERRLGGEAGETARVGELVLLSRRGEEPMRPRATVALGTGEVRWLDHGTHPPGSPQDPAHTPEDDSAENRAREIVERLRCPQAEGVVHVAGSRRLGCALPGADLDLVLALPSTADLADVEARVRAALPEATGLRRVIGARVPGLRFRFGDLDVDLVVVPVTGAMGVTDIAKVTEGMVAANTAGATDITAVTDIAGAVEVTPAEAVSRRTELDEASAIALSAVGDADAVLASVGDRRAAFVELAREVKAWARARGLDSAPFGGLPGLAWTVLAARTVREAGDLPPGDLLRHFFGTWAAWDWHRPIVLRPEAPVPGTESASTDPGEPLAEETDGSARSPYGQQDGRSDAAVSIMTPTAPVRLCSEQVGAGGRDLLTQELYNAWEIVEAAAETGRDPRPELLSAPPSHRRHAAWAVVTVRVRRSEGFEVTLGRVRGRMRALLTSLERAGVRDAHAWPRPFEIGRGTARYAVGLGRTPPDAARLAEITAPWATGLRGVGVEWTEGGEVPTLL